MEVVGLVAQRARELAPDVVVLAGDVCPDLQRLERSLRLIVNAVGSPVLYLPGNHELWCGGPAASGPHSRERYFTTIPRLVRRAGAVCLGVEPHCVGPLGFVGVTGWYDYSLADPSVGVSVGDYATKRFGDVTCVDGHQVHWPDDGGEPLSDEALCETMCTLLEKQLDELRGRCSRVVAVTHMLPTGRLLPGADPAGARSEQERFLDAFMGSERLGELLVVRPEVVRVVCGHYHRPVRCVLPGPQGEIPCEASPVGYPREIEQSLEIQVSQRMRVVEV